MELTKENVALKALRNLDKHNRSVVVGEKVFVSGLSSSSPIYTDLLKYDVNDDILTCYEVRSSKRDFISETSNPFLGHFNYYIVPASLGDFALKYTNGKNIGVYTINETLKCIKKCSYQKVSESNKSILKDNLLKRVNRILSKTIKKINILESEIQMREIFWKNATETLKNKEHVSYFDLFYFLDYHPRFTLMLFKQNDKAIFKDVDDGKEVELKLTNNENAEVHDVLSAVAEKLNRRPEVLEVFIKMKLYKFSSL